MNKYSPEAEADFKKMQDLSDMIHLMTPPENEREQRYIDDLKAERLEIANRYFVMYRFKT